MSAWDYLGEIVAGLSALAIALILAWRVFELVRGYWRSIKRTVRGGGR